LHRNHQHRKFVGLRVVGGGWQDGAMQRTIFTDEHEMFRDAFRQFVDKEIVPGFLQWEADGIVPRELFAAAGASGFLGMDVPEELGGGGVEDFRYNLIIGEELQRSGTGGAGLGITLHNDICLPYFTSLCTDEQKQRWLPGICSGELITAIAMTEPGIGSDLASMGTTAIRDGDRYVVNGSKTFITNGINADLVITAVKTDPSQKHKGMSLVVLERGMEGFERGRNLEKVGLHSQDTAELFFTDVQVPVENLLGTEGQGFVHLVRNLPQERLSIATSAVAACEAALGWTLDYVQERKAFNQPVGSFQNSRFKLAEMRTEIDIARCSSTAASRRSTTAPSPPRRPPRPSGGARSSRSARSTPACSSTAATATCSSTPSPGPTPMLASPRSTAAPPRS
jgi:alkylation response protein AidB-like acyl-CoA dehydrogenase